MGPMEASHSFLHQSFEDSNTQTGSKHEGTNQTQIMTLNMICMSTWTSVSTYSHVIRVVACIKCMFKSCLPSSSTTSVRFLKHRKWAAASSVIEYIVYNRVFHLLSFPNKLPKKKVAVPFSNTWCLPNTLRFKLNQAKEPNIQPNISPAPHSAIVRHSCRGSTIEFQQGAISSQGSIAPKTPPCGVGFPSLQATLLVLGQESMDFLGVTRNCQKPWLFCS